MPPCEITFQNESLWVKHQAHCQDAQCTAGPSHLLFCRGHAHMPVSAHTGVGDGGHSGTIGCARQAVQQSLGILVQHALQIAERKQMQQDWGTGGARG
eukprot:scaffold54367_cov19-Tisochrysis_lutea.AAC.4